MVVEREVSVREAARLTRRSEETIRRWIWSRKLPASKRGNSYRVDIAHLERVAAIYAPAEPGHESADGGLTAWLDGVDQWKRGLAGAVASTAAELITEDRRARR
jgi:excisionase family DNA binding protein